MGFQATIGKDIRERRKELGITQSALAELAEVNVNTIMRLERGLTNPTLEVLVRIGEALGMEVKMEVKYKA
ncbi:MAG: helix-turn-helix transcriptional regulator [Cyclobacteriaceae bacterium]|nr:helix-turn-helix transcriptional regulator [Cyclobacteriaceae bacterium]